MRSIQGKILAVVISCIMIMTIAISAISLIMTNEILHQNADVILDTRCKNEAMLINSTLEDIQFAVSIMEHYADQELANSAVIRNSVFRHTYTEKIKDMFTNIASDIPGVVGFYLRYNPELSNSVAGFFSNRDSEFQNFIDYPLTDLSMYAPDDVQWVGWFYQPKDAGEPIWLDPYYNLNTEMLMVSYVTPLYKTGEFIGVLGIDIDFSVLIDKVNSISVYENGRAYLVDRNGVTIHNDPGRDMHRSNFRLNRYAESSADLNNGMSIRIQAYYSDIQKGSLPVIHTILIASGATLILFIILTVIITRRLVSPLKKLTTAAQELATGKTDVQVDVVSRDEIGTLSSVFNHTARTLHEYMNSINALAYRDSLTGLRNRTAYIEAIQQLDERLGLGLTRFGALVADINWLKQVNDNYGHDLGSELIRRASKIICIAFSHSPVFRVGGDEFVVFLENTDLENLPELLEKLDRACAVEYIPLGSVHIPISIARGVAVYDPGKDDCVRDVLTRADHEMYAHKQMVKSNAPKLPFPTSPPDGSGTDK